jgi:hypothetical protein
LYWLTHIIAIYHTIIINKVTVAQGLLNAPAEGMAFQRTPSAFAQYHVLRKRPRGVGTHNDKIGLVARTDEASVAHFEE